MVASLFVGCGGSPETEADAELRAAIDVARRHYLRAAGAMGVLTEAATPDPAAVVRENAEVFDALDEADKALTAALTAAGSAGREVRARAQRLLADVRMAAAEYRDLLVRGRTAALTAQQARVAAEAERLGRLAAQAGALRTFVELSGGPDPDSARPVAARLKAEITERLDDLDGRLATLRDRATQIRREIETLQTLAERKQTQATALRQQILTTDGVMVLELDERASALEAEVEKAEGEIAMQEVALEDVTAEIEQFQLQRETAAQLLASLDAWMNGLADRREIVRSQADDLQQRVATQQEALASVADALADQVVALLAEGEAALEAGRKAADANAKAVTLLRQLQREAQATKVDQSNSPMMPVLETLSSQGLLAPVTAQAGDVALVRASLQHHRVEVHTDLVRLRERVDGLCRQAGLSGPEGLARAVEAGADINTFAEQADQQYQAAEKAFNDVAGRMLARSPVNTKDTEWRYRGAQARALYGRYQLAVLRDDPEAATYRKSATTLVKDLLEGHQGDAAYASIEQIARGLGGD
ncbi:MAG: hypothetical protein ACOC7R_01440 [Planctomycetota bacterium]